MLFAALFFAASINPSPKAQMQASVGDVRRILAESKTQEAREAALHKVTISYVDFSALAKTTLDSEWDKLSKKQQKDFAKVLEDLIEASYLGRLDQSSTVDIAFSDEKIDNNTAQLEATAHVQGSDTVLLFTLHKGGTQWMCDDVELDDVSLSRNYRNQFAKVIAKDGYGQLVGKLRKKIAELKNPPPTTGGAATKPGPQKG